MMGSRYWDTERCGPGGIEVAVTYLCLWGGRLWLAGQLDDLVEARHVARCPHNFLEYFRSFQTQPRNIFAGYNSHGPS